MKKMLLMRKTVLVISLSCCSNFAFADTIGCWEFVDLPSFDISKNTTAICSSYDNITGALINHGELVIDPFVMATLSGSIDNYGIIKVNYELKFSGSAATITNQNTGVINSSEWLIINAGKLDNYGTVNFAPLYGDTVSAGENFFALRSTAVFNNYGITRFDGAVRATGGGGQFNNQGRVEVTPRGNLSTNVNNMLFNYTQTKGETLVDGAISFKTLSITNGKLSGSGTVNIASGTTPILGVKGVVSPGAPIGTLNIAKTDVTLGGSLDIELSGPDANDKLNIVGNVNLNNTYLNVVLRQGYIPPLGSKITILSANQITGEFLVPVVPLLPMGACWVLEYTNTEVTISTSGGGNSACL